eukprot:38708_1
MNSYFVSQTNRPQKYSLKRRLTFSQLGYSKIGIKWTQKTMWFSFWPKIRKQTLKIHAYDDSTCRKYEDNLKIQMEIVYDNIGYLPYELNSADIKIHMLHQKPTVYVILDEFCDKYINKEIQSVAFFFKIKKRAPQIVHNEPVLSPPILFPNSIFNAYGNQQIIYGVPVTSTHMYSSYPNTMAMSSSMYQ